MWQALTGGMNESHKRGFSSSQVRAGFGWEHFPLLVGTFPTARFRVSPQVNTTIQRFYRREAGCVMATKWMDVAEAGRYIGRNRQTLYRWRKQGLVRARLVHKPGDGRLFWQYSPGSLKLALAESERRRLAKPVKAGPGRGKWKSADQAALF